MTQQFKPIAIIGRGCILPGCTSPTALWETVVQGLSHITEAPTDDWRISMQRVLSATPGVYTTDHAWSDKGGYVRDFVDVFDASESALDADLIASLDPVFQWSLYAAQQALINVQRNGINSERAGLILGNLSYPTRSHTRLAEQEWVRQIFGINPPADTEVNAHNRFMSGLPAMLVAKACGLAGGSLALDAACASGLYAIKIACDRLQDGRADLMLAGAVNAADQLFLHVGFSALNALSHSGQSRPFHQQADGLLPAEGAAFVALKRLEDAEAAGDKIYGVIRGIGLSNDGRSGGFLSPSQAGQTRSMQIALAQANLAATAVQYVECHATGTLVGDATEIASLASVYGEHALVLGSLKANLGHLITASGIAGLMKALAAMEHACLPAALGSRPLSDALLATRFIVPETNAGWDEQDRQRTAAVSSFGFGGNNAHLIVQQYPAKKPRKRSRRIKTEPSELAIVGIGIRTQLDANTATFAARLLGDSKIKPNFDAEHITLNAKQLSFPPNELKQALGQQLILMDVAQQAIARLAPFNPDRTGIYVGMQTDSEVCRYAVRMRWPELMRQANIATDAQWLTAAAQAVSPSLDSSGVIGRMPNIAANRLSNSMNFRGASFTVSREELSGDAALELACTALRRGEIDTALVGAVDLCREEVHEHAALIALGKAYIKSADAAVMLVIKSRAQAELDGNKILALITGSDNNTSVVLHNDPAQSPIYSQLGHAHAASGLLNLALGALMLRNRARIVADGSVQPWLRSDTPLQVTLHNSSFIGETALWTLTEAPSISTENLLTQQITQLRCYAASNPKNLIEHLRADQAGGEGSCRLALVGEPEQLDSLREKALQGLVSGNISDVWDRENIVYRQKPLDGELAYVFTGAASAYPGMGRELLLAMPQLVDGLSNRFKNVAATTDWAYIKNDPRATLPFYQLAGSSFLCQLHTQLSRSVLGLNPAVAIGLSSGETNAMFAFGIWQDIDGLFNDIKDSGLYSTALANRFDAVRTHWGLAADSPVDFENYRLLVNVEDVAEAIVQFPRVYLTIINSPQDCVIGGSRSACQALLSALGNPPAMPLGHNLAIHCEVVMPFAPIWRTLHTRSTTANENIRYYSNYFGGVIEQTQEKIADALTGQALHTIDFPKIILKAWEDGVRIFVEHGPRNSLSTAIQEILGKREYLSVALDRAGISGLLQAQRVAAELWCAGVNVNLKQFQNHCASTALNNTLTESAPVITFCLRPPKICVPSLPESLSNENKGLGADVYLAPMLSAGDPDGRLLPAAPPLARLVAASVVEQPAGKEITTPRPAPTPQITPEVPAFDQPVATRATHSNGISALLSNAHRQLVDAHMAYMRAQTEAMQAYLSSMERIRTAGFWHMSNVTEDNLPHATELAKQLPSMNTTLLETPKAVTSEPEHQYPGPSFNRQQLEVLAGGRISSVFGKSFADQDQYAIQVRMPEPPLLLCDRVLGIEGKDHSMGQGTIWTETDVRADSWYLHDGRMPAGIFIESGQADLLLISWLGIDAFNRGNRAYRLLGCELVFYGELPEPGETLEYVIKVDGHAQQGDVRLFFFHYDCHINGELRISVRSGQAGFFSKQELQNSAGVIWNPQTAPYTPNGILAPPPTPTRKTCFSTAEINAYLSGNLVDCFGEEFYWADTHTRTPRTPAGEHSFLGTVTQLDLRGGPAGRGYLRIEKSLNGNEWFFQGHFKNDPCMPGTLMAEACLQAMAFYMVATGRSLQRDGWRFQPVTNQRYKFVCRGQVTPDSKQIVYELFIDEIFDTEMPMLFAHVLCSVDGRKAFLCEKLGIQLVPDWPLSSLPEYLVERQDNRPLARIGDFPLDYRSLINCAWGKPSRAFGQGFSRYDDGTRLPRLPGPPYHFMTRITELHGKMAQMQDGARVTAVYDLAPDAWFFKENVGAIMPNCVLMEIALQPCGWLSSFTLQRKASECELLYRNLDGDSVQHRMITPEDSSITTEAELLSVSQVGDLIIEKFAVRCSIAGDEVLKLETVFGFFPPAAMANQKGFGASAEDNARLTRVSEVYIEFKNYPERFFGMDKRARLPSSKLLMLDRISGYWPDGGAAKLGAIRAEKDINSKEWFFKAHFFQDPVQPGSLGIEAMLQTIQSFMLLKEMDVGIEKARFEPICPFWHYRGQVTPDKNKVVIEFESRESGDDERGVFVIGMARLWVDGLQIYQAPQIGMRILRGKTQTSTQTAVRNYLAKELFLHPSSVTLNPNEQNCLNLPFNRLEFNPANGGDSMSMRMRYNISNSFNWQAIRHDWITRVHLKESFILDIGTALVKRFIRRAILADPIGYKALQNKPVLYFGNHQTSVETFLFLSIVATLTQKAIGAISREEHKHSWIGLIHQLAMREMGNLNPLRMLFFDRSKQSDMLRLLQKYSEDIVQNPYSLLVHVEGRLEQVAGATVKVISSVLIDFALAHDMPIVPVRFAGGLPLEPIAEFYDFPYQLGQQDFYIGSAINLETVRALPYAQRAQFIADHINQLGPAGEDDKPLPGDSIFTQKVDSARAEGRGEIQSVLCAALRELPVYTEFTKQLMADSQQGPIGETERLALELLGKSELGTTER